MLKACDNALQQVVSHSGIAHFALAEDRVMKPLQPGHHRYFADKQQLPEEFCALGQVRRACIYKGEDGSACFE
eukprot:5833487-Lingulodinium_polyedra.AAC.1